MTGDKISKRNSRIQAFSSTINNSLLDSIKSGTESRIMGCSVYNLFNVVVGSFSSFCNPNGAYVWDLLPGLMLAYEHNCSILVNDKPFTGEFLDIHQKHTVLIHHQ